MKIQAKEQLKNIGKYFISYVLMVALAILLLVVCTLIPRDKLKGNLRESADYIMKTGLFELQKDEVYASQFDHYADAILLNIVYGFDKNQPLKSAVTAAYYKNGYQNEDMNLDEALRNNMEPNLQYLRYWHGEAIFVTVMLLIVNVQQMYIFHGIVIFVLVVILLAMLIRKKHYGLAASFTLGLIAVSTWFVSSSLEYTWMFILMLIMSIVCVKLADRDRFNQIPLLLFATGIMANYFDFLTTETITGLVPMLMVISIYREKNRGVNGKASDKVANKSCDKAMYILAAKSIISWGLGYVLMWITKWVVAAIILQQNVMPYINEHISERMSGGLGLSKWAYLKGAITRNLIVLFPIGYGQMGKVCAVLIILGLMYLSFVYKKKNCDTKLILVFAIIGLIPFVRFMVLCNHSYLHFFFTHRALLTSVMAVLLVVGEAVDWRYFERGKRKKR